CLHPLVPELSCGQADRCQNVLQRGQPLLAVDDVERVHTPQATTLLGLHDNSAEEVRRRRCPFQPVRRLFPDVLPQQVALVADLSHICPLIERNLVLLAVLENLLNRPSLRLHAAPPSLAPIPHYAPAGLGWAGDVNAAYQITQAAVANRQILPRS